jgi:ABC-type multidrug transport system fused ATPase/permease subunit
MLNNLRISYLIIPQNYRKVIVYLIILLFLNSSLEVLSISSLIPVIKTLTNPGDLSILSNFFNINTGFFLNKNNLTIFFSLLFLFCFVLKSVFYIYVAKYVLQSSLKIKTSLTKEMFNKVLLPAKKKNKPDSEYIANIQNEVGIFIDRAFLGLVSLLTELLTIAFLIIFLFFIQPYGSMLSFSMFLFLIYLINIFTKKKIEYHSKNREDCEKKRIGSIQEIVFLLNEIKLYQKENFFINSFLKNYLLHEQAFLKLKFIQALLKPSVELVGLIALIIFFIVSSVINNAKTDLIIIEVGVVIAASFKIIPSVYRIAYHFVDIRFAFPVIKNLYDNLFLNRKEELNENVDKKISNNFQKIELNNVFFNFDGSSNYILENINLAIKKGEKIGICGPSGSGKTTLVNLIIGFLKPNAGKILVNNSFDITENNILLNASYVSQNVHLINDSLVKNIAFGCDDDEIDYVKLENVIKWANIQDLYALHKCGKLLMISENSKNLSGGQKQRISIARAMYFNSEIIILDEASSALDSETEKKIISSSFFLDRDKTLIFISHKPSFFEICDRVYEIKDKNLYEIKNKVI